MFLHFLQIPFPSIVVHKKYKHGQKFVNYREFTNFTQPAEGGTRFMET